MEIRKFPDDVLRKKSKDIKGISDTEKKIISDMVSTMYATPGAIGLAAPQVGISKKIIVSDIGEGLLEMINPKIISTKGKTPMEEGCLSLPQKTVTVRRAEEVTVTYMDGNGQDVTKTFTGLSAKVVQHEMDHLSGKLIIDYQPWYKKILRKKTKTA